MKAENGVTTDVIDIRHPLGIEIEYEVLQSGHVLIPNLHFFNEEGVNIFILHNFNSEWRNQKRPVGRYVSTAWLPGNFLSEGRVCVGAAISTYLPFITHFYEADAVTFHVVDDMHVDAARGDYKGHLPGVIRPIMPWTTEYKSWTKRKQRRPTETRTRPSIPSPRTRTMCVSVQTEHPTWVNRSRVTLKRIGADAFFEEA